MHAPRSESKVPKSELTWPPGWRFRLLPYATCAALCNIFVNCNTCSCVVYHHTLEASREGKARCRAPKKGFQSRYFLTFGFLRSLVAMTPRVQCIS